MVRDDSFVDAQRTVAGISALGVCPEDAGDLCLLSNALVNDVKHVKSSGKWTSRPDDQETILT